MIISSNILVKAIAVVNNCINFCTICLILIQFKISLTYMKTAVPLVLLGLLALSSALSTSHHNTTTTTTTTTTPNTASGANSAATPPAAPQPCGFNVIGDVPANKDYTYEVKNVKTTATYNDQDFTVNYKPEAKPHNFFTWLGKTANFHDAFIPLGCQIGTK